MNLRLPRVAMAGLLAFAVAACSDEPAPTAPLTDAASGRFDNSGKGQPGDSPTIVDIAVEASEAEEPQFTVLVAALQAAGLVDALDGKGQFTVFAPTDAAFGRLLEALDLTAAELLADTALLEQVLLYHVAPGARLSGDVLGSDQIRTLQGGFIFPVANANGAFIVDTNAVTEDAQLLVDAGLIDIQASNGVIHVIDEVLLFGDEDPRGGNDAGMTIAGLVQSFATAEEGAEFTILLAALEAADLVGALDGQRQFTVFAPTDAAFLDLLDLLDTTPEALLANTELLTRVLLYHVVPGERFSGDVLAADEIRTVEGGFLSPLANADGAFIVDANALTADARLLVDEGLVDVDVSNGVVHVIDQVLLPAL